MDGGAADATLPASLQDASGRGGRSHGLHGPGRAQAGESQATSRYYESVSLLLFVLIN